MNAVYWTAVTLHVLAALFWLGGMFFLAAVAAPALRGLGDAALRQRLFQEVGRRFRTSGWIAIGVLVTTGVVILHIRGLLRTGVLADPAFWATPFGEALAWKLALVAVILVGQGVHDFVHGPRASRARPGSEEALRMRRTASLLARLNAVLALGLVYVAVRLARGGL